MEVENISQSYFYSVYNRTSMSSYNILVVVLKCGHFFAINAPLMAGFNERTNSNSLLVNSRKGQTQMHCLSIVGVGSLIFHLLDFLFLDMNLTF
jgi:hypothetical protein